MSKGAGFVLGLVALAALSPASGRKQKVQKQTHSEASALNSQKAPEPSQLHKRIHGGRAREPSRPELAKTNPLQSSGEWMV
jgi:hypothetical protein